FKVPFYSLLKFNKVELRGRNDSPYALLDSLLLGESED
ncbi:hypothetical protein Tco_1342605, partial [Tanacetum coccineum]